MTINRSCLCNKNTVMPTWPAALFVAAAVAGLTLIAIVHPTPCVCHILSATELQPSRWELVFDRCTVFSRECTLGLRQAVVLRENSPSVSRGTTVSCEARVTGGTGFADFADATAVPTAGDLWSANFLVAGLLALTLVAGAVKIRSRSGSVFDRTEPRVNA